jgi:hypothetical protein
MCLALGLIERALPLVLINLNMLGNIGPRHKSQEKEVLGRSAGVHRGILSSFLPNRWNQSLILDSTQKRWTLECVVCEASQKQSYIAHFREDRKFIGASTTIDNNNKRKPHHEQ